MKIIEERLDLYATNFYFIDCSSRDEIFKEYGIEFNEVGGVATITEAICIIINTKYKDWTLDILVHECVHAATALFERINAEHDFDNEEPYAYVVGWLFGIAYKELIDI